MSAVYGIRNEVQRLVDSSNEPDIKKLGEITMALIRAIEDLETKVHHEEQTARSLRNEVTQLRSSMARLK